MDPSPVPGRVLTRAPPLPNQPQPQQPPCSQNGVVVVGFISQRPDSCSHLINRVLDSNIFGSGHHDTILNINHDDNEDVIKDWFRCRRISYYHEVEKGVLFLQFCPTRYPVFEFGFSSQTGSGFEEQEFGDLQGLLFMFSVCHVIMYIQEGSRFDTQLLKKFRVLQAAKQALAPYARSRATPPLPSRPSSSSSSRPSVPANASKNSSPARGGSIFNCNTSSMSLMSGLGSYPSLFPGHCIPVTLFVFLDDFSDMPNASSIAEESTSTSAVSQSSNLSGLARSLPMKGSGSVVMLARPGSKSEGGSRKKLQSSLEAQIRFLIKKCRTLSGSESSHLRSGSVLGSTPLFSLDASKIVVLLERAANKKGEALEFATGLVDDVLDGKAKSDSLLLETNSHSVNREDILLVKEFIYRQSDILRGRGGLVANSNNAGVGMVAVAAAAAAASAASGKTFNALELPNLDVWLSSSRVILLGIITAKNGSIDEIDAGKRKPHQRNISPVRVEGSSSKVSEPLDIAVSWLRSGKGLNTKFSTLWCERALPAAKDVYLKDLPACYPTPVHETHLQKALLTFNSMVRGPSVEFFAKRLVDECTSIWKSGRQLCDAVSLTGKPCMHQRHNVGNRESLSGESVMPHSSGYVFLHACACGRSRRLRDDPFDFESANATFNCFPDCDKLLPILKLPEVSNSEIVHPSSWSLIRVGNARYYEPSKGLLQSGFCSTQKFLSKWKICLEKKNILDDLRVGDIEQDSTPSEDSKVVSNAAVDISKAGTTHLTSGDVNHGKPLGNGNIGENKISFGRGFLNVTMKKPFSEVVAGSATSDLSFPPLQQRKLPSPAPRKPIKQNRPSSQIIEQVPDSLNQGFQKTEHVSSHQETLNCPITGGNPCLQIGSNVVPVYMNSGEKARSKLGLKTLTAYIGFEHECPHGHRFLLNMEHLSQLGPLYSMTEEAGVPHSTETSNFNVDPLKVEKNPGYGKSRRRSNRMATGVNKMKNMDKPKQLMLKGNLHVDGHLRHSSPRKEHNQTSVGAAILPPAAEDLGTHFQSLNLADGGHALSMLNRNLPLYMTCPHCLSSKKDPSKTKYAGTISQLQRIFLLTPPFPVILATCPVIEFQLQESCLPPSVPDREKKLQFSLGYPVILPPESFLTLRLPFIYGVQSEDGSVFPLNPSEQEPERTAWIVKGTTFQLISKESSLDENFQT